MLTQRSGWLELPLSTSTVGGKKIALWGINESHWSCLGGLYCVGLLFIPCSLFSVEWEHVHRTSFEFPKRRTCPFLPVSCREQTCRMLSLETWPRGFLLWWRLLVPSLSSGILVPCASVCFWFNAVLRTSCIPKLLCRRKGKYVISASWNLQGERRDQA